MDDPRTIRSRLSELAGNLDRLDFPAPSSAHPIVVRTVTVATYPTTAGRFYGCQVVTVGGVEAEGNSGSFTLITGVFYVLNLGSAIPPVGTNLIAEPIDGRWTTRFD